MATSTLTRQESLIRFLSKNPGTLFTLDEIANGTGIPRQTVSYQCTTARSAGHALINPMIGQWGLSAEAGGDEITSASAAAEADGDEADGDEAEVIDEAGGDEAEVIDEAGGDEAEVIDEADGDEAGRQTIQAARNIVGHLFRNQLFLMVVGHDKQGNRIVTDRTGQSFRLVEL